MNKEDLDTLHETIDLVKLDGKIRTITIGDISIVVQPRVPVKRLEPGKQYGLSLMHCYQRELKTEED